jgi:hypothetical protein
MAVMEEESMFTLQTQKLRQQHQHDVCPSKYDADPANDNDCCRLCSEQ